MRTWTGWAALAAVMTVGCSDGGSGGGEMASPTAPVAPPDRASEASAPAAATLASSSRCSIALHDARGDLRFPRGDVKARRDALVREARELHRAERHDAALAALERALVIEPLELGPR
ncbi:Hypothetical protein I5071_580 (plasmid) [Sandaracinus amylolyticus]|uniref:hypothetical protein n=1 Tax=Sandaracinus sp. TaxID=2024858 RepID=UPI0019D44342|nr:hypothetical protein [Sandaracinus sp.]UJR87266.1 Hypothetical protein I5071_580 [Sandaracinus amylolyticus]